MSPVLFVAIPPLPTHPTRLARRWAPIFHRSIASRPGSIEFDARSLNSRLMPPPLPFPLPPPRHPILQHICLSALYRPHHRHCCQYLACDRHLGCFLCCFVIVLLFFFLFLFWFFCGLKGQAGPPEGRWAEETSLNRRATYKPSQRTFIGTDLHDLFRKPLLNEAFDRPTFRCWRRLWFFFFFIRFLLGPFYHRKLQDLCVFILPVRLGKLGCSVLSLGRIRQAPLPQADEF